MNNERNQVDVELENEMRRCHDIIDDIEHKLEDAYAEENPREIKRCMDALETLNEESLNLRREFDKKQKH